jgi:two-component system KDP operon response regulator KdpE
MPKVILIIDDERAIAQLTSMWVKAAGYTPITAFSGESGLAAAALHRPQLILLDIRMPDLDGFEVNRRLQDTPELSSIPIVFLSAHAQEAARREALIGGAHAFLSKPYEFEDLTTAIRAALRREKKELHVA